MNKIKKYNVLGVITARGGSKGLPGKNIKMLGGKPLIAYTVDAAKKSKFITHLIVSTDDKKIAEVAKKFGVDVPFLRPERLATDKSKHLDVMKHATKFMEKKLRINFDCVVILQPTSPFRTSEDIDNTVEKLIKKKKASSAVSVYEIDSSMHPMRIKKMKGDRILAYCVDEKEGIRRQNLPMAYKRSGDVYAIKRDLIMKKNKLFGDYVIGHIVPKEKVVDIDNEFDWLKAEYILKKMSKHSCRRV